tara:strand:+ start:160 stop:477 length:318 start_codon:yes stop_codon:yes gene_type:complete
LTRAKVIQLGLIILLLGGLGYLGFRIFGFDEFSSGIAAQSMLVLLIIIWVGSYFSRVFSGNMTFNEQRKRYRKAYDQLLDEKLKKKFNSMSEEEQIRLIKELENK